MRLARSLRQTFLFAVVGSTTACSIPGIRPEGRTTTVSAFAPAGRADVHARARDWFARNGYVTARDVAGAVVRGYRTIATEGDVETRAVVDFEITASTAENTSYRVASHTERGRPPAFRHVDQNAPEANAAVASLIAYLSCPTARWPRCP